MSESPGRRKKRVPIKDRPRREREEALRILHGHKSGPTPLYDDDYHPDDLVTYFRERVEKIAEVERVRTKQRDLKFVQEPIPPPTLAGWAAKVGVSRHTVRDWAQKHDRFGQAKAIAEVIQEDILLRMGTLGAYDSRTVAFMLKNLHDWSDKAELRAKGNVHIHFDSQDEGSL